MRSRVSWFFTAQFAWLVALLTLASTTVVLAERRVLAGEVVELYRATMILPIIAIAFLLITAHELAHGMTCKWFGGEVHEIGLILIYFQPAMYCNVSDAWLFPERSKRLLVGFAGPVFELFLWSLATLTWRLTEPDTWVHTASLIVLAISGIKTLANFNPFIKLDGYYLLSDYLEIPNLRRKAFRYIGGLVERLFTGETDAPRPSRRERPVFLAYGLISGLASLALAAYVLLVTGEMLLERHQPLAFLASAGLVAVSSKRRLRRMFAFSSSAVDPEDDEVGGAERRVSRTARERGAGRGPNRRQRLWLLAAAVALVASFLVRVELRIGGGFAVSPSGPTEVRTAVEGIVQAVLVAEGDEVAAGTVIAQLSSRSLNAAGRGAEAEIRETRAQLDLLEAGPRSEEIELARIEAAGAEGRLDQARRRLAVTSQLLEQGLVARKDFEDGRAAVANAENESAAAKSRLGKLLNGSRPEEIAATRARLERLQTQHRFFEEEQGRLDVLSPTAGVVATPTRVLQAMTGKLIEKGGLIARVHDLGAVNAVILVPEKEISDVEVGQHVVLRARAFPGQLFRGTVRSIATVAGSATSNDGDAVGERSLDIGGAGRSFVVTASIDNPSRLLKPEMTGQAKVLCGKRSIASLILRRLVRTFKIELWSWW
jgi:multidrug resistance efflux pump